MPRGEHLQCTSLVCRVTFSYFSISSPDGCIAVRPRDIYMNITIGVIVSEFMHATSAALCSANCVPKSECFRITYAIFDEGVPFFAWTLFC